MQYIYAALLLNAEGKEINEANVKKVLEAAGTKADDARVKALVASLDGVNIEEAVSKAAVTAAPAAAAPAAAAAEGGATAEEKKEEPEEEGKTEEEAAAGLGALFG